jgi:hypothetical protein
MIFCGMVLMKILGVGCVKKSLARISLCSSKYSSLHIGGFDTELFSKEKVLSPKPSTRIVLLLLPKGRGDAFRRNGNQDGQTISPPFHPFHPFHQQKRKMSQLIAFAE